MPDNHEESQFDIIKNNSKDNYIRAIDQYKAILTIPNISARSNGLYICSADLNRFLVNFSTTTQLHIRSLNDKKFIILKYFK